MVDKTKYIKRFQEIYKRKTGNDISDEMALEYFEKLVALTQSVYVAIPKNTNNL